MIPVGSKFDCIDHFGNKCCWLLNRLERSLCIVYFHSLDELLLRKHLSKGEIRWSIDVVRWINLLPNNRIDREPLELNYRIEMDRYIDRQHIDNRWRCVSRLQVKKVGKYREMFVQANPSCRHLFSALSHSDHVLVYLKVIHVHVDFRPDLDDVSRPNLWRKTLRSTELLSLDLLPSNISISASRAKKKAKTSTDRPITMSKLEENDLLRYVAFSIVVSYNCNDRPFFDERTNLIRRREELMRKQWW